MIDREQSSAVLSSAFINWGPSCYEEIPVQSLLRALPRARDTARLHLISILGNLDPTPEIIHHLVQQLDMEDDRLSVEIELGSLGEADLGPVVHALRDSRALVRRRAASALAHSYWTGPLDLPEAVIALEHARRDPSSKAAHQTDVALWSREQVGEKPLDWYVEKAARPDELQILARRKAFCHSKAATEVLDRLARDEHLTTAYLAKRAIALRERRCAEGAGTKGTVTQGAGASSN